MALQRSYGPRFEKIWAIYPKWPTGRSRKELAWRAFQAADRALRFTEDDVERICQDIRDRLRFCETWQKGNKFGPVGLQVYMNQHLWNEPYKRIVSYDQPRHETVSLWERMGYASEADYYAGRRMH